VVVVVVVAAAVPAGPARSRMQFDHNAKILKEVMEIYPAPEFLCHYSTSSSSRLNLTMVS